MEENIIKRMKRKLKGYYEEHKASILAWGSVIGLVGLSGAIGYLAGKSGHETTHETTIKVDFLPNFRDLIETSEKIGYDRGLDAARKRVALGEEIGLITFDQSKWGEFSQRVDEEEK